MKIKDLTDKIEGVTGYGYGDHRIKKIRVSRDVWNKIMSVTLNTYAYELLDESEYTLMGFPLEIVNDLECDCQVVKCISITLKERQESNQSTHSAA